MASEYQYIEYNVTPVYSATSGIAPAPSIVTKDSSMDMANPSAAKNLYVSKADSPYYNPNVMGNYPISTKTIPYTPTPIISQNNPRIVIQRQSQSKSKNSMLPIALIVFLLFVLFMSSK